MLGDERGWFPSNYVEVISDEEAEVALSGGLSDLDQHSIDQQSLALSSSMSQASSMPRMASDADSGMVDMSHAMLGGGAHLDADEWLDAAGMGGGGMDALAHAAMNGPTQSNDFWMPQVTPGGQVRVPCAASSSFAHTPPDLLREHPNRPAIARSPR